VGTPPFTPALRDKPIENGGKGIPLPAAGTPFDPESRLYARSAGDDKAPILAMMTAIDALRASGLTTRSNIKFAFEGEEEANSANLEKIFTAHRKALAADLWLVCDGPVHQTRRQSIVFGARGISAVDVTVYGPRVELHSGHYGNWAPNPAMLLVRLLASMKDDGGRVLVDHDKDATFAHIVDHVRTQGFFVVDAEPSADVRRAHAKVARVTMRPGGYNSVRTSMDLPISQEIIRTVERARGAVVKIPNMGAGVPLDIFEPALGAPAIVIPIANHDDNQHSVDENIRIQNLWDGIELMTALLTM
jgi:acetylornithine deacetylase/succinyl-diaminopimelate desuccinylase-like protein